MHKKNRIAVEDLKCSCDARDFNFNTTDEIEPFEEGIIGQDRAEQAMELGFRVKQDGYNIFITGLTGTGRTTYAKTLARKKSRKKDVPPDFCYVYNFKNSEEPKALSLPAGKGAQLKNDMQELIKELQEEIPKLFESEEYEKSKNELMSSYQESSNKLMQEFENKISKKGFVLQNTSQGLIPVPLDEEDNPIKQEDFQQMEEEQKKEIREQSQEIQNEMEQVMRKIRGIKTEAREELENLEKKVGLSVLQPIIDNLRYKYDKSQDIISYLDDVQQDIINNLDKFNDDNKDNKSPMSIKSGNKDFFLRYQINLLVDNKELDGAPVIYEPNPTYYNLFGKIEARGQFGTFTTDFTMIKSGAVHRANGGYLILKTKDVLTKPFSWETLKRILINQEIAVENIGEQYRTIPVITLKAEAIPVDIKIIMIGSPYIYQLLYNYDEEFKKLFKIKADFDTEMKRNQKNMDKFASFISCICKKEGIRHFTAEAVSQIIEYSCRLTGDTKKLSTRFNEIMELLYEANTMAELAKNEYVEKSNVLKAIAEKEKRSNLVEEKIQEMIVRGHILIDTDGKKAGQINGLSVYQTGHYSFGRPSRITAQTYLGRKGVINIEREAKMSGKIHNKAVLILSGYLGGKYAQDKPLTLSASLAFEQSYGGIEGDSASCAELIALLSAISGIPIRQDLAITGSLNQLGDVQPIGGVNEKIEGFFRVCKEMGLSGKQGVVIPVQNVDNLMLKQEILEAVKNNNFNIYNINNIDEAIELMMDKSVEEIHFEVEKALKEFALEAKEYNDKGK